MVTAYALTLGTLSKISNWRTVLLFKKPLFQQEIQDKGLTAPRLTPALIDATIDSETYTVLPSGRVTICEMALKNGFVVLGESSCVSKENFNAELGQKIARENARNKIWELEGYLLKQRLFETQNPMPQAILG